MASYGQAASHTLNLSVWRQHRPSGGDLLVLGAAALTLGSSACPWKGQGLQLMLEHLQCGSTFLVSTVLALALVCPQWQHERSTLQKTGPPSTAYLLEGG